MASNYVWTECQACKEFSLTPDLKWHEDSCRRKDYGKLRLTLEVFDKNSEENFYNSQKCAFLWLNEKTKTEFKIGKYLLVNYIENLYLEEHFKNFEAVSVLAQVLIDKRINRNSVVFNLYLASLLKCQIEKDILKNKHEPTKTPDTIDKILSPASKPSTEPTNDNKKSSSKKKKNKKTTPNKISIESSTRTNRKRVKAQVVSDNDVADVNVTIEIDIIKPKNLHLDHTQQLSSLVKHHCEGSMLRHGLVFPLFFLMEELILKVVCIYGGVDMKESRLPGHKWVEVNQKTQLIVKTSKKKNNNVDNNINSNNNNNNNIDNNINNNNNNTPKIDSSNKDSISKRLAQNQGCNVIGYEKEKKQLTNLLELSGTLPRPLGVLISGPSGSGKSALAEYLCQLHHKHHMNKDDSISCSHNNAYTYISLMQLYTILQEGEVDIPMNSCLIVLDSFDLITAHTSPNNDNTKLQRFIGSLFTYCGPRLVISTVTNMNKVASEFTLATRFSMLIDLKPPSIEERFEIFKHLSQTSYVDEEELKVISDKCHAFLPQDIALMLQIADVNYGLRPRTEGREMAGCLREAYAAMKKRCRLMKKDYTPVQAVTWNDIVGYEEVKKQLQRMLYLPLTLHKYSSSTQPINQLQSKDNVYSSSTQPANHQRAGSHLLASFKAPKGILLYGPPGCSKTMIAKALATESKLNFIAAKSVDLISKYVGESEKNIRSLFKRARSAQPCVLFFDEVDSIACNRERSHNTSPLLTTILTELDGVVALEGVFVVAATNAPFHIDASLLRPGRLGQCVYISLPDVHTRHLLLSRLLSGLPVDGDVDVGAIVRETDMFSGSEMVKLVTQTSNLSLLENIDNPVLKLHHFHKALSRIVPAANKDMLEMYQKFSKLK